MGDIIRTIEDVQYNGLYYQAIEDVQYNGGYFQYIGGCSELFEILSVMWK